MVNKNKDRSFERIAYRYWEKLVGGILVPGERGYVPSEKSVYHTLIIVPQSQFVNEKEQITNKMPQ